LRGERKNNKDRHLFSFKIGEFFKMDYSAVSHATKRFKQKSEANNEIKENMQKVIMALKEI
jgi:chromosomal replication initiation ATPase DnaA